MKRLSFAVFCLLIVSFLACSSDDPVTPETPALKSFLMGIESYPDPAPDDGAEHKVVGSDQQETETAEGRFVCTTTDFRMDKNMHEIVAYDINAVSLWPGAVVQGKDLKNGVLNLIALPRAPLRVGTDLPGLSAEENSRTVAEPDHLNVRGAINDIVDTYLTKESSIPAKLGFTETFAESYQQAMLDLSIDVNWSGWSSGSVQSDISTTTEEYETAYYCMFTQSYFTASAIPPTSPEKMFQASVGPTDCDQYMADGNPPCYVAGVTFGRIGILAVYSHYERLDVQTAVQMALDDVGWDMEIDSEVDYESIINESEVKLLILGGNATDGVQAITGDRLAGLYDWIESGAELDASSNGLPVAYVANYLKDNRLAKFGYSTEWTVEECYPVDRRFHVDISRLECTAADDGLLDNELEVYYTFKLQRLLPDDPIPVTLETWSRGACNAYNMSDGSNRYPDAEYIFDMPDLAGAKFRLHFDLDEDDGSCENDTYDQGIGSYYTSWYEYPLWQEANADCDYPADWGQVGGTATCNQHLSNEGMGIRVYWSVTEVDPQTR
jgi:hypothetical protein